MVHGDSNRGMRFDGRFGCPTIGRIVKACEGRDAFRRQGASKVSGAVNLSRSHTGPPVRADKPAASWRGSELGG